MKKVTPPEADVRASAARAAFRDGDQAVRDADGLHVMARVCAASVTDRAAVARAIADALKH